MRAFGARCHGELEGSESFVVGTMFGRELGQRTNNNDAPRLNNRNDLPGRDTRRIRQGLIVLGQLERHRGCVRCQTQTGWSGIGIWPKRTGDKSPGQAYLDGVLDALITSVFGLMSPRSRREAKEAQRVRRLRERERARERSRRAAAGVETHKWPD